MGTVLPSWRLMRMGMPLQLLAMDLLSSSPATSPTGMSASTSSGTFWLGLACAVRKMSRGARKRDDRYSTTCTCGGCGRD